MSAWVKVIQVSQAMILIPKTCSGPSHIPRSLSKSEGWSKNQKVVGPTTFTGGPTQYQHSSFVHGLMNIQKPKGEIQATDVLQGWREPQWLLTTVKLSG